jgi:hypothetical protein
MLRRSSLSLIGGQRPITRAQRLQLGNIKTDYSNVQTAAGNHEKWGFMYRGWTYPHIAYIWGTISLYIVYYMVGTWSQYRDMIIMSEYITYEDVEDRALTPMPGWNRLKSFQMFKPWQAMTYRDPTPLDWLPFELKLGSVANSSY